MTIAALLLVSAPFLHIYTSHASAWTPPTELRRKILKSPSLLRNKHDFTDPLNLIYKNHEKAWISAKEEYFDHKTLILSLGVAALGTPTVASAATAFAPNAIFSALVAYVHYASILGIIACLVTERLIIKPNMSVEDENLLAITDAVYGFFGLLIAYTGYLRVTSTEKGFDFYAHEPIFWLMICFVGIVGAASFFNTTKVIQRSVPRQLGKEVYPMSEALANRMVQICNAQLLVVVTIPLAATFMARGILYTDTNPWQAEAGLAFAVFLAFSFKYINEAVKWED